MELEFLQWINENLHDSGFVNMLFKCITFLGEGGVVCILLGVILLCIKKTRKSGAYILIGLALGIIITNVILKPIVARPRPFAEDLSIVEFLKQIGYALPSDWSFPSGHTQVTFNVATMLTLIYKKKGAWAYIPAGLVAISRIFLCVHYPTDVLCGVVIGVLSAVAVYFVANAIVKKINNLKNARLAIKENSENN